MLWRVALWLLLLFTIVTASALLLFGDGSVEKVGAGLMAAFFVAIVALDVAKIDWRPPF